ncbi:hypothetical protein OKW41_000590 [Paraburkholderia sp. UCT70]
MLSDGGSSEHRVPDKTHFGQFETSNGIMRATADSANAAIQVTDVVIEIAALTAIP